MPTTAILGVSAAAIGVFLGVWCAQQYRALRRLTDERDWLVGAVGQFAETNQKLVDANHAAIAMLDFERAENAELRAALDLQDGQAFVVYSDRGFEEGGD